ncbi:hypothetical protein GOBAR_DD32409 [Gossypium barbadense]|nr:hypothetical protein GOBAR_DD32409 [Gossypium barbadense]
MPRTKPWSASRAAITSAITKYALNKLTRINPHNGRQTNSPIIHKNGPINIAFKLTNRWFTPLYIINHIHLWQDCLNLMNHASSQLTVKVTISMLLDTPLLALDASILKRHFY